MPLGYAKKCSPMAARGNMCACVCIRGIFWGRGTSRATRALHWGPIKTGGLHRRLTDVVCRIVIKFAPGLDSLWLTCTRPWPRALLIIVPGQKGYHHYVRSVILLTRARLFELSFSLLNFTRAENLSSLIEHNTKPIKTNVKRTETKNKTNKKQG